MPAKTKSPAEAQKKVWKAELRDHQRALKKITRDHAAEKKRITKEIARLERERARIGKSVDRAMAGIVRRTAILQGRIGI